MRIEAARKLVRGCAREAQRCLEHNIDGGPQNKAPVPQKDRDHAIMGGCATQGARGIKAFHPPALCPEFFE